MSKFIHTYVGIAGQQSISDASLQCQKITAEITFGVPAENVFWCNGVLPRQCIRIRAASEKLGAFQYCQKQHSAGLHTNLQAIICSCASSFTGISVPYHACSDG